MKYSAIIEMAKGESRRIHMSYDNTGFIDLGPIKEQIPLNNGIMPVHYGYIEGTLDKKEGDNVDVIVFSDRLYKTGDRLSVEVIGMLTREDGDHKVVAVDDSLRFKDFSEISSSENKLILDYFGFKSKIVSIDGTFQAEEYIKSCRI